MEGARLGSTSVVGISIVFVSVNVGSGTTGIVTFLLARPLHPVSLTLVIISVADRKNENGID